MKRILFLFTFAFIALYTTAQTLNVAAAANLRYVLEEIKTAYLSEHPKSKINITFGSSGTLVQQIMNGASFDFFLAADNEYPLKLKEKGLTSGPMMTYAFGKLALYSTTLDVEHKGLDVLTDPAVKKIAIANPKTAPYGDRSVELLTKRNQYEQLKDKLVVGDNISQAAQYAFTGNAEVGFIALSYALAPDMKGKGSCYIIPQDMYTPVEQACILLKTAVLNTEASVFRKFILSSSAKSIWEKYGYAVPKK